MYSNTICREIKLKKHKIPDELCLIAKKKRKKVKADIALLFKTKTISAHLSKYKKSHLYL